MNKRELGNRISLIRKFRGITQAELGIAIGFNPTNATVRMSQYESGMKKPKDDLLVEIAKQLNCSPYNFIEADNYLIYQIELLFWQEENIKLPIWVTYNDTDTDADSDIDRDTVPNKNGKSPLVLTVSTSDPNETEEDLATILKEWQKIKDKYISNKINFNKYFEWKITWPDNASNDIKQIIASYDD